MKIEAAHSFEILYPHTKLHGIKTLKTLSTHIFKNLKCRVMYGRLDIHEPLCLVLRHFITTDCDVTV